MKIKFMFLAATLLSTSAFASSIETSNGAEFISLEDQSSWSSTTAFSEGIAEMDPGCETQKFLATGNIVENNIRYNYTVPMIKVGSCTMFQYIGRSSYQIKVYSNALTIFDKLITPSDLPTEPLPTRENLMAAGIVVLKDALNNCGCSNL